jgi:hypothetical protein
MALTNFFRINLPYGMHYEPNKGWVCFNREYIPLGWNDQFQRMGFPTGGNKYDDIPIFTNYKITNFDIERFVNKFDLYHWKDEDGKINRIWFYDDGTNPTNSSKPGLWERYFEIIKYISNWRNNN